MKIKDDQAYIEANKTLNLKEISANEISVEDVFDIYDGPLNGISDWKGKKYLFYSFDQLHDDHSGDAFPSKYLLITFISSIENSTEISINKDQIVGWFDSSKELNNKFIKSYFEWKDRTYHKK